MKRVALILLCLLLVFPFGKTAAQSLSVGAEAAVLMDANTGEILFALRQKQRLAMASTTKIMTALLLCENVSLQQAVKVPAEAVNTEGTSLGLRAGMLTDYQSLLYGMLLSSGNDAARATAILMDGSESRFCERMNRRAAEMQLSDTHFQTASGLDAAEHYTTAADLAELARQALSCEEFARACRMKTATVYLDGKAVTVKNHHRLLTEYPGCIGVKTGYTSKAGRCLVTAAQRGGRRFIAVTLNDRNDWQDHTRMLDYAFSKVPKGEYDYPAESYSVSVIGGKEETVEAVGTEFSLTCQTAVSIERISVLPKFLYAPVSQGEVLGSVEYYNGNRLIARQKLVAEKTVEQQEPPNQTQRWFRAVQRILQKI